jgi:zinc D-Ala-D-Ala carboxypeptidase
MIDAIRLSAHFTLAELTHSETAARLGLDNTPPIAAINNLRRLCFYALEPAREILGCPLFVSSGYRSAAVNEAVVSTAPHSAHLDGRAADFVPVGLSLKVAFDQIRRSMVPYDQVLIELGWIHLGMAEAGQAPRRQAMTVSGGPGHWEYTTVA